LFQPRFYIRRVVAIDLVEDTFATRYPSVDWRQVSALEMPAEPFDTVWRSIPCTTSS
jgi:hypothetical protein